jgi:hypothetical protein
MITLALLAAGAIAATPAAHPGASSGASAAAASGGAPAYYHPDAVAKDSAVFAHVAESMGPSFEDRQGRISAVGAALGDLELGVGLLGAAAPPALTDWSLSTRRRVVGETLRLQKHVDLLQDDYARVFGAAVDRALPVVGKAYTVTVCGASGVIAMMGHTTCTGTDLNGPLAAAIDADAGLKKELADIASVEWPSFDVPTAVEPVVALTGTTRWVSGGAVARALIGPRVTARQGTLESALDALLPDEPTKDDLAKAQALKDAYLVSLGKDGDALRTAITASLTRGEKKGGPAAVAWCANPVELGGCAGEDATRDVLTALQADKKLLKEIAGLATAP